MLQTSCAAIPYRNSAQKQFAPWFGLLTRKAWGCFRAKQ
jgi:hypothetical protein